MQRSELLKLAHYIKDKTRELVPYSSNRPSLTDQPFHRIFWLDIMRARNDQYDSKNKLRQWHMNLEQDRIDPRFEFRRVTEPCPNNPSETPTLGDWDNYIISLPEFYTKTFHKDGEENTILHQFETQAKNAVKFGIGNCYENALTAFNLLLEYPTFGLIDLPKVQGNIIMEIARIQDKGDHVFVVLNRDPKSDIKNMSTWGPDAIILDPWMNAVVVVEDELKKAKNNQSNCFKYIHFYQKNLHVEKNEYGFIAEGHSSRWKKHRTNKNEPLYLRNWKPFYSKNPTTGSQQENIPWENHTTSQYKKRKRA